MHEICMRFAWDLHEICVRFAWDLHEIFVRFVWDLHEISQNYVPYLCQISPLLTDGERDWGSERQAWFILKRLDLTELIPYKIKIYKSTSNILLWIILHTCVIVKYFNWLHKNIIMIYLKFNFLLKNFLIVIWLSL